MLTFALKSYMHYNNVVSIIFMPFLLQVTNVDVPTTILKLYPKQFLLEELPTTCTKVHTGSS